MRNSCWPEETEWVGLALDGDADVDKALWLDDHATAVGKLRMEAGVGGVWPSWPSNPADGKPFRLHSADG